MPRNQRFPYLRISADLAGQIRSGELRPGDQIPTLDTLCRTYQVSRATALHALDVLREHGWITTTPRWGSFVADEHGRPLPGE